MIVETEAYPTFPNTLLVYEFNFQDARIQTEACWSQQTSLPKKDFEDHFLFNRMALQEGLQ